MTRVALAAANSSGRKSRPFSPRRLRSSKMMSGCSRVTNTSASARFAASPTTTSPGRRSIRSRNPSRMIAWSSMTTMRIGADGGAGWDMIDLAARREPSSDSRIYRLTVRQHTREILRVTKLLALHKAIHLDEPRDDARPAGLVAGADARAVIAVEEFVEQDQVAPVRISLEFLGRAVDWPLACFVAQEDATQAPGKLLANLEQVHLAARAGRALDGEAVAIVAVELKQPTHHQPVDRHPDRPAPVRIAAEHACRRLGGLVGHAVLRRPDIEDIRM